MKSDIENLGVTLEQIDWMWDKSKYCNELDNEEI